MGTSLRSASEGEESVTVLCCVRCCWASVEIYKGGWSLY